MTLRAGFFIFPVLMWGMDGLVHPSVSFAVSLAASFAQSEEFPSSAVIAKNANLRASPSLQGTILAVVKEGHVVHVLGKGNSWYQVQTQAGTQGGRTGQEDNGEGARYKEPDVRNIVQMSYPFELSINDRQTAIPV